MNRLLQNESLKDEAKRSKVRVVWCEMKGSMNGQRVVVSAAFDAFSLSKLHQSVCQRLLLLAPNHRQVTYFLPFDRPPSSEPYFQQQHACSTLLQHNVSLHHTAVLHSYNSELCLQLQFSAVSNLVRLRSSEQGTAQTHPNMESLRITLRHETQKNSLMSNGFNMSCFRSIYVRTQRNSRLGKNRS